MGNLQSQLTPTGCVPCGFPCDHPSTCTPSSSSQWSQWDSKNTTHNQHGYEASTSPAVFMVAHVHTTGIHNSNHSFRRKGGADDDEEEENEVVEIGNTKRENQKNDGNGVMVVSSSQPQLSRSTSYGQTVTIKSCLKKDSSFDGVAPTKDSQQTKNRSQSTTTTTHNHMHNSLSLPNLSSLDRSQQEVRKRGGIKFSSDQPSMLRIGERVYMFCSFIPPPHHLGTHFFLHCVLIYYSLRH
jgi:hypothetical protein